MLLRDTGAPFNQGCSHARALKLASQPDHLRRHTWRQAWTSRWMRLPQTDTKPRSRDRLDSELSLGGRILDLHKDLSRCEVKCLLCYVSTQTFFLNSLLHARQVHLQATFPPRPQKPKNKKTPQAHSQAIRAGTRNLMTKTNRPGCELCGPYRDPQTQAAP